jgi:hypothetical protein
MTAPATAQAMTIILTHDWKLMSPPLGEAAASDLATDDSN